MINGSAIIWQTTVPVHIIRMRLHLFGIVLKNYSDLRSLSRVLWKFFPQSERDSHERKSFSGDSLRYLSSRKEGADASGLFESFFFSLHSKIKNCIESTARSSQLQSQYNNINKLQNATSESADSKLHTTDLRNLSNYMRWKYSITNKTELNKKTLQCNYANNNANST